MRDARNARRNAAGDENRDRHGGVRLSTLVPEARFIACDDMLVRACHDDAEACRAGDVFVARLTDRGDGHEAVPRAIARGAVGVIAERIVATDGLPLCLVPDSDRTLARLAHALAGNPSRELRVVAVAGTSGKTTTAWLAASVLAEAGCRVGVLSDLGCLGPDDTQAEPDDIESPAALARWLARLSASGCSHAVVEVSSRMLAARATAGMTCDTVVVTNLAAAHLERHGTRRAYRDITARIVESLGTDGCLVTGAGSRGRGRLLADVPAGTSCLTAGLAADCDVWARPVTGDLTGRTFVLGMGGQMVPVAADTPTVSFVRDAVLAAAVGARYGIALDRAARGIEAAGSVPGRVERIDRGQDACVFVDAPTSMHAVAATLGSLRRLTGGRLVVLADERLAARLGGRGFQRRLGRWCDESAIVPASIAAADPDELDIAAYARVDRLLESLGAGDCAVVFGAVPRRASPAGPHGGGSSLAAIVDGWLQLAHPPVAPFGRRRAA
jgi:UDP-N-acetylmuramoyl-L-alanyl-D-glutamate--2,6-diaminopimelate ligase